MAVRLPLAMMVTRRKSMTVVPLLVLLLLSLVVLLLHLLHLPTPTTARLVPLSQHLIGILAP
nr:MAG TPA: hypothetical protein [Caudoviricetes sp.]